jgi:hypothetical protein
MFMVRAVAMVVAPTGTWFGSLAARFTKIAAAAALVLDFDPVVAYEKFQLC